VLRSSTLREAQLQVQNCGAARRNLECASKRSHCGAARRNFAEQVVHLCCTHYVTSLADLLTRGPPVCHSIPAGMRVFRTCRHVEIMHKALEAQFVG
jgi:hypothetical protein